jgi:hypothetical protein
MTSTKAKIEGIEGFIHAIFERLDKIETELIEVKKCLKK